MLWGRESDVVTDRQDDLLRLWRSTNSIDQSVERSKMSGLASQADPQYVEILEREELLQQRLRIRSTFAVTGDGETREANYKFSFWFFVTIQ